MNFSDTLTIKYLPSRFQSEADKPYVLFLADYGRIGDKLNVGASASGKRFPLLAAERFATAEEAFPVYEELMAYIESIKKDIPKPKKPLKGEVNSEKKKKKPGGRPSWHSWK